MLLIYEHSEGAFDFRQHDETMTVPKADFYIPGATTYHADQSSGYFLYQIFRHASYTIYRSTYRPSKDIILRVSNPAPFLGFRVMLQKHIGHVLNEKSFYLMQGQSNFVCAPNVASALYLKKNEVYEVFDLELSQNLLQQLQRTHKPLQALVEQYRQTNTIALSGGPAFIGVKPLQMIDELLLHPSNEALAVQLTEHVIDGISRKRSLRTFTELHIENVFRVKDHILSHLTSNDHVPDWAKMANMNITYFKELFREVFDVPPYHYLIHERIKAAKYLLQHQPSLSLSEIALAVGFNDYNNLRRAFQTTEKITLAQWQKLTEFLSIILFLDQAI